MTIADMNYTTTEQVNALREAAIEVERERDALLETGCDTHSYPETSEPFCPVCIIDDRDDHEQARTALEEALGQVQAERDTLAAHVEEVNDCFRYLLAYVPLGSGVLRRLEELRGLSPEASLARRDNAMKAEAFDMASDYSSSAMESMVFRNMAEEYRRQAEGVDHE